MKKKSISLQKWIMLVTLFWGILQHIGATKAMQDVPDTNKKPTSSQSQLVVTLTNGKQEIISPLLYSPCVAIREQGIAKDKIKSIEGIGVTSFMFMNFNDYTQLEKLYFPQLTFVGNLHLANTKLKDLIGFPKLKKIVFLDLKKQIFLTNISGLNKLTKITQICLEKNINITEITGLQSLTKIKIISKDIADIVKKMIILKPTSLEVTSLVCGYMHALNATRKDYADEINKLIISYSRPIVLLINLVESIA